MLSAAVTLSEGSSESPVERVREQTAAADIGSILPSPAFGLIKHDIQNVVTAEPRY